MRRIFSKASFHLLGSVTGVKRFYHGTSDSALVKNNIVLPLTHFEDFEVARQRLSQPEEARKHVGPGHIMEVQLKIREPLSLEDIENPQNFNEWRAALEKRPDINGADLMNHIFVYPGTKLLLALKRELTNHNLFDPNNIPHINPYNDQSRLHDAARCVTIQRLIHTLEAHGYDSVKITNAQDNHTQSSYVVFRPEEQVSVTRILSPHDERPSFRDGITDPVVF